MKLYVKSATLIQIQDLIKQRLSVPGVSEVEICKIRSRFADVRLHYDDGSRSKIITVTFNNKPDRFEVETDWNPNWSIRSDGAVLDESGEVIGWFKLLKRKPQKAIANYREDSLVVNYGTRSKDLTPDSGEFIAKIVKKLK